MFHNKPSAHLAKKNHVCKTHIFVGSTWCFFAKSSCYVSTPYQHQAFLSHGMKLYENQHNCFPQITARPLKYDSDTHFRRHMVVGWNFAPPHVCTIFQTFTTNTIGNLCFDVCMCRKSLQPNQTQSERRFCVKLCVSLRTKCGVYVKTKSNDSTLRRNI